MAFLHKAITSLADLGRWRGSMTFDELQRFISVLSDKVSEPQTETPEVIATFNTCIFECLGRCVDEVPAGAHLGRFANPVYREFVTLAEKRIAENLADPLNDMESSTQGELLEYIVASLGDRKRMDYGTGHELNFLCFLYCAVRVELLPLHGSLILLLFNSYIRLARRLQATYQLEPAGSKGAWGLDDYQHLPFVFGAAQLQSSSIRPADVFDQEILKRCRTTHMYIDGIAVVLETKTGGHPAEMTPILFNVSQTVASWHKIRSGMTRMYIDEVLLKFPVAQHILFGSVFPFE